MKSADVRILVVDDDEAGRYVKAHTLETQGYTVVEAALAQAALAHIMAAPPELVLLDVRLPDGDGVEVCRQIKSAYPQVTVLQTSSALISAQDRALALDAGADSYLIEPIEPDELVAVVKALLRLRDAEQGLRFMNETLEARVVERTGELAEINRQLVSEQKGRRQAEDILWHTQRLEAVGRLTGGIAHDFNNLLTIVSGNLELLQLGIEDRQRLTPERQLRLLAAAQKAVDHGAQMTQQLLVFARQGAFEIKTVDLNETISGMENFIRRTLGDAVSLDFAQTPGLWRSNVDPVQFEAALVNLAINARDAMPEGGRLRIELSNVDVDPDDRDIAIAKPGPFVRVAVADTGIGMEKDVVERAFEPFFTTKGVGEGSGLGLSQVYGFASQSGGFVRIASTPGIGTRVALYLPRCEVPIARRENSDGDDQPNSGGRETILIVEDDEEVRNVAAAIIEDLGYTVMTAADGIEARAVLQTDAPIDLLFSDIRMPGGLSGIALATEARSVHPNLKVLLTSGYPAKGGIDVAQGPFPIIHKPYRRDRLAAMLRSALDFRPESAS